MRYALPGSLLLHLALVGGAWLALNANPPEEETGLAAVSVSLVTLESFTTDAVDSVESSATEALVAAGATPVEEIETVELADTAPPETMAEERPQAATPPPVETVQAEPVESLPVLSAALTPEAVPVEAPLPMVTASLATTVAASAAQPIESQDAASPEPVQLAAVEPESLEPVADQPLPPIPLKRPERLSKPDTKVAEVEEPRKTPKKPTEKTPEKKPVQKAAPAGNGGQADANVAASKASSGGKASGGGGGSAAVDKYPGQVHRALRRALRFPKGAGRARGEVEVTFVVSASGTASQIAVSRSSGHEVLDREAIATVKRAAPFPPIPDGAGRSSWTFTMPLAFTR